MAKRLNPGLGRLVFEVYRSHTQPVGLLWTDDQFVAEAATGTTRNNLKRRTSIPSTEFEFAIPARDRLQTYFLDTATGIG